MPQGKAVSDIRPQSKIFNEIYFHLKNLINSQNIGLNYHVLDLCKESLFSLNPYDDYIKLKNKKLDTHRKRRSKVSYYFLNHQIFLLFFDNFLSKNNPKGFTNTHFII